MPTFEYRLRRNLRELRRNIRNQPQPGPALVEQKPANDIPVDIYRCPWCVKDPLYIKYHDTEWGKFCDDNRRLFEFIVLETSQAGLSWLTILRKRENYRAAFAGFDPFKVAHFTDADIDRLAADAGIIRSRAKIAAAVNNARAFIEIIMEFDRFSDYLLTFFPNRKPIVNSVNRLVEIPASTPLSERISADLKKRGFRFFGATICYAHLQATGFVNDHLNKCSFKHAPGVKN